MIYLSLSLIIVILILIIISLNVKIKNTSNVVEEIMEGNFNQRIRMQNHNKYIKALSENLNSLIERFQGILKQNKDYEEERKRMISNISHDLRTPLTSLLGYVELLNHDKNLSEEETKEYTEIVETKGNALLKLMEEFFQVSKLDSNDMKLNIKSVNISEILRQSIVLLYNEFTKLSIEPIINIPDEDLYALGDEGAINRILNNLISNSLTYGIDGGVIGLNLREEGKKIVIDVWDRGKGIPENDMPFIFNRLYTLEKSRNRKFQGSGLGLTISKKLAENLQSKLTACSIPYEKTTFTFTLRKS